ncbi:unnamed protein product [Rotaria sp. Silwood1]|nr:unnamed protein product [Rotaria sp. Silwood1]
MSIKMNDVEALLSRLPALKHLRLLFPSCEPNSKLFDGSRWEKFIQTKLPLLDNSIPNYFFQNVTKLCLSINQTWSVDLIKHLSTIVNLSCLKKLTLILWSKSEIVSFHEGAKILFNQSSNLRSIELMCDYNTVGKLFLTDIVSNLPCHVKHLETSILNPEHATMILERAEYLSNAKFQVFNGYEFWSHITRWLSQSGREATIQEELVPHHCATAPPTCKMYLWFEKRTNKQIDTSAEGKRMKLMHPHNSS